MGTELLGFIFRRRRQGRVGYRTPSRERRPRDLNFAKNTGRHANNKSNMPHFKKTAIYDLRMYLSILIFNCGFDERSEASSFFKMGSRYF